MPGTEQSDQQLISVIIAAYNAERFIERTLQSVFAQTHTNLEIIVVDDGSADRTVEIVERHRDLDPRLILVRQQHGGVSEARNLALRHARGSLVAIIDSDDLMKPDRLARQAAFLAEHSAIGFCGSAIEMINESDQVVGEFTLRVHTLDDVEYMTRNRRQFSITHPTVMFRKAALDAVGGYVSDFEPAEDLHLFLRMHDAGFPGVAMPDKLTQYRLHLGSISGSRTREQVQMKDFLFHNFYAKHDGQEPLSFDAFRKRGSTIFRAYARWRETADIIHSRARYRRGTGRHLEGNALMAIAVIMKAERFPARALKALVHKSRRVGGGSGSA